MYCASAYCCNPIWLKRVDSLATRHPDKPGPRAAVVRNQSLRLKYSSWRRPIAQGSAGGHSVSRCQTLVGKGASVEDLVRIESECIVVQEIGKVGRHGCGVIDTAHSTLLQQTAESVVEDLGFASPRIGVTDPILAGTQEHDVFGRR